MKCKCVAIKSLSGRYMFTDKSNCFVHAPSTAKHNAEREKLIKKIRSRQKGQQP